MKKRIISLVLCTSLILSILLVTIPKNVSAATVNLILASSRVQLKVGNQSYEFTKDASNTWAFEAVYVNGVKSAKSISDADSFYVGRGRASGYNVITNSGNVREIQFYGTGWSVNFKVNSTDRLPMYHVQINGPTTAIVKYRTANSSSTQHGAWLTRGIIQADVDRVSAFIDTTNPLVFGHSFDGTVDSAYTIIPMVNRHIVGNGTTQQQSGTNVFSGRNIDSGSNYYGYWGLDMGSTEFKQYKIVFDKDLGGRLHDVCEKYYSDAVDTAFDIYKKTFTTTVIDSIDDLDIRYEIGDQSISKTPVLLSNPRLFIPNEGWAMSEGNPTYPNDTIFSIQQAFFMYYEGMVTGRDWEKNFGKYVMDNTPVKTRYFKQSSTPSLGWFINDTYSGHHEVVFYMDEFYYYGLMCGDNNIKNLALDIIKYTSKKKLNLTTMRYPSEWDTVNEVPLGANGGEGQGFANVPQYLLLGYRETGDTTYLTQADQMIDLITTPFFNESKMDRYDASGQTNWSTYGFGIINAMVDKYKRSGQSKYLDVAKDISWIAMMLLGTTPDFPGVSCTGTRGAQDYDCSPNECVEQSMPMYLFTGSLLDYASGSSYMKFYELAYHQLAACNWIDNFAVQPNGTVLRTFYDTETRGMANLMYSINNSSDNKVIAVEKMVSKLDMDITKKRDMVVANGTTMNRSTTLKIRYLKKGTYDLLIDGVSQGNKTSTQLAAGISLVLNANTFKTVKVNPISLDTVTVPNQNYDNSIKYLSDMNCVDSGSEAGSVKYTNDKNAKDGNQIQLSGKTYKKGIGMKDDTAVIYDLQGNYKTFKARVGIDASVSTATNPDPSVIFTVFVDGVLKYDSGAMLKTTTPVDISIDVTNTKTLVLRMSDNVNDSGNGINDVGSWADARLVGRSTTAIPTSPTPTPNLLLDRSTWTATASSSEGGSSPSYALDSEYGSRWASGTNQAPGQWFICDMKSQKTFGGIRMDANVDPLSYPKQYQVYVSNDGSNWGAPIAEGNGNYGVSKTSFTPQTARYIKVVQNGNDPYYWWCVNEFYVNVTAPSVTPTLEPSAQPKVDQDDSSASFSSHADIFGNFSRVQIFTPGTKDLAKVDFYTYKTGSPTGALTIQIVALDNSDKPIGSALYSQDVVATSIPSSLDKITINTELSTLIPGTKYGILIKSPSSANASNCYGIGYSDSNPYSSGYQKYSTDGGVVWNSENNRDLKFTTYKPAESNVALNKKVTVNSYYQNNSTYSGDKAADGYGTTRWATDAVNNAWMEIDLGGYYSICKTVLKECKDYGNRINAYDILYWDGVNWVNAYNGGVPDAVQTDKFIEAVASKVRLNLRSDVSGPTIWEFEVYGSSLKEPVIDQNNSLTSFSNHTDLFGSVQRVQIFTPTTNNLSKVDFYTYKTGAPAGDLTIQIATLDANDNPSGVIYSMNIPAEIVSTGLTAVSIYPNLTNITSGVKYGILLKSPNSANASNAYGMGYSDTNPFTGGYERYSSNSGSLWTTESSGNRDLRFITYR